ncbi:MAG: T9SS type A sorting domain-containing protein [Bacteroidales bacterium]|nr:T9SS type A sorting domain-containing protein [Bacteroidales bacterium]
MKKTLLIIISFAVVTLVANAQRTWVVGNDPVNFPVSAGIGAGPDRSVFITDLGIHTGTVTSTNMGQVEVSSKTFGEITYPNRFKFNGGGYASSSYAQETPTVNMPTQRFLTIKVSGSGSIKIQGVTGNSGEARRLFVTDGTNLIGTMVFPSGSAISEETVNYTGGEAMLYLYCNAAINLYNISASSATTHTSLSTGVKGVLANNGIFFNGQQISNSNNLSLEVYNVLGKLMVKSTGSVNTDDFQKGVYVVRAEGIQGALKFSK